MSGETVKVIVRCRPVNEREERLKCDVVVGMDQSLLQVQLKKPGADQQAPAKQFTFDGVYNMQDTTQKIYEDICFPLVSNVLEGYNGTVFAYGQTGCGKSFTMVGVDSPTEQLGIIPRAFDHIFDHISVTDGTKFLVQASYLEIYNEEVRDLLGRDVKRKLDLKEHPERGVYVSGLSMHKVNNRPELENVMAMGSKNRSMGATLMNVDSSRSHCIFSIDVEMMDNVSGEEKIKTGKLNLVDLAGSERQSKTGATGERLKEATKINLSLSALGNVISALVDGKAKHIPYRDSKLTRLLQSSLGGNTKTLMVACISPADNNYDETLSTLRYANRAKNIKNKPKINEDPKDALLREYQEEIKRLKMMLSGQTEMPSDLTAPVAAHTSTEAEDDHQAQIDLLKAQYEEKLSILQDQYGNEQANRAKLEQDMLKLQSDYEAQIAQAKAQSDASNSLAAAGQVAATMGGEGDTTGVGDIPIGTVNGVATNDKQIIADHEAALQKLASLQEGLIGGERSGDDTLKEQLEKRRQHAEERLVIIKQEGAFDGDDVLERIFNNITDEVKSKTRALEKMTMKCRSTEEEIKDLQSEFEEERQDLLDTIRKQQRMLQLQTQLLDTVVPLLRRDCNYYNMDKIRAECKYDEDRGDWVIPKVSSTSTNLSSIPINGSVTGSSNPTQQGRHPSKRNSGPPPPPTNGRSVSPTVEDDKFAAKWQSKGNNVGYFSPKRAKELLTECTTIKNTPPTDRGGKIKGSSTGLDVGKSTSLHHLDQSITGTATGKPGTLNELQYHHPHEVSKLRKLNALPGATAMLPPLPSIETSELEKADKLIQMKRKPKPLDPLTDHGRKH